MTPQTFKLTGPSGHVQAAVREILNLLEAHRDKETTIPIRAILKSTLLLESGKGIQTLFQKVNEVDRSAGYIGVNFGTSSSPSIVVKAKSRVHDVAVELVEEELRRLERNIVELPVDEAVIPVLIGRKGQNLKDLRGDRVVNIEFLRDVGKVLLCGMEKTEVQAVVEDIEAVIEKHRVERIPLEPSQYPHQIRELLRTKAKEVNALVYMRADDDKTQVVLRGTDENLKQAGTIVREFVEQNYLEETQVSEEDMTALLTGGKEEQDCRACPGNGGEVKHGSYSANRGCQGQEGKGFSGHQIRPLLLIWRRRHLSLQNASRLT